MSSARNEAISDPIAYFIDDLAYHGKSRRTREAYDRVLRRYEAFLSQGSSAGQQSITLEEATHRDCIAWIHSIRAEMMSSTVATYASYLHRFYTYMSQIGIFESNPMTIVMEEIDETIDTDPARRDISVPRMREFVSTVSHPLDRAVIVTLLKTGVRAGELCNLDLRDLYIPEPSWDPLPTHRAQLDEKPNSLYVDSKPKRDDEYNGERRAASNKRKRPTVVPVDGELGETLLQWLAIRPDTYSPADPLFISTRRWGNRLTPDMVHHIVETHARSHGWFQEGGDASENVTPHYFRHFFTTHLRDRTGDRGVVKYLRGDVASDVIDTYTHNWGDRVREVYETNVYTLT